MRNEIIFNTLLRAAVCCAAAAGLTVCLFSCRKEEGVIPPTHIDTGGARPTDSIRGFFILNEGNKGSNKATLDYFDYATGVYSKNIYPSLNPAVVQELGDVGHDIQIYGSKLYAVINCSHLVEVMDAATARHIATVAVPNCRYITFDKGYAYVSSYAGPVLIDPGARLGYVAKIDTATLRVIDSCVVGYQPEELVVCGHKLYVANSGGYRVPDYDNTVSVVDLTTFDEVGKIVVGINLHRMKLDAYGYLWVSSRGDYKHTPSKTYVLDTRTDLVKTVFARLPNSAMSLAGDSLYVLSSEWSELSGRYSTACAVVDVRTQRIVAQRFITDGTELFIERPYGVAVNPETREILVTDAKDYVTPGVLYCFLPDGKKRWEATTGDIPSSIVFTRQRLAP